MFLKTETFISDAEGGRTEAVKCAGRVALVAEALKSAQPRRSNNGNTKKGKLKKLGNSIKKQDLLKRECAAGDCQRI